MSKKGQFCFLNGKFVKEEKAFISVNDIGLHRGYGVFDVLRTYYGKPFLLNEHLNRLFSSAKDINLKIPYKKKELSEIILKLIRKNKFDESIIKIILTGGNTKDGITFEGKPTLIILNKNLPPVKESFYKNGVKLITYNYQRIIPPTKTLDYIHLVKNQSKIKKEKAHTLLYVYKGKVLEGATCNVFIFKKDKLITPASDILKGITRNLVIKLAKKDFVVEERKISLKELLNSDEVFITSTTKGVLPVVKIDSKIIASGKLGKNTQKIIDFFNNFIKKTCQK